jgi:hypothetical protein
VKKRTSKKHRKAVTFLRQRLEAGPVQRDVVINDAVLARIAPSTLERVSREIEIIKRPAGFRGQWTWALS